MAEIVGIITTSHVPAIGRAIEKGLQNEPYWKPFFDVVENSIHRACKAHGVECLASDAVSLYDAVPTWQPHPNVVEVLEAIAPHVPLVILSNSMVDLIPHSVAHLKAPFHAVYTAEEARAYKPRMQAFEYMFDQLGCGPDQMMHVSSSFRYDLMTASDLGFMAKAFSLFVDCDKMVGGQFEQGLANLKAIVEKPAAG